MACLLENPAESELWYLPEVMEIIQRNPEWVIREIREINRCAYGWREKKPTKIMTTRPAWIPKGRTCNGRCKAGRCTNSKEKDLGTRDKRGGRNEKAVKNALEEELIEVFEETYRMII